MRTHTLILGCGVPGSGKSTWFAKVPWENTKIVSRDTIRFKYLEQDPSLKYFAKEDDVWKEYVNSIKSYLKDGYNVIADATHLNKQSRFKIINALSLDLKDVVCINFHCSLEECLARNEKRKGTLGYVPELQLRRMYFRYRPATKEEGYSDIVEVNLND